MRKSIIKRYAAFSIMIMMLALLGGCDTARQQALSQENKDLKQQVETLKNENKELKDKLILYVPQELKEKSIEELPNQPIKIVYKQVEADHVGSVIKMKIQNLSGKTIDEIQLALLTFDSFGKPLRVTLHEDNVQLS